MKTVKLKSCPFCGESLKREEYIPLKYRYRHPKNDCFLSDKCVSNTKTKIDQWNRRVKVEI